MGEIVAAWAWPQGRGGKLPSHVGLGKVGHVITCFIKLNLYIACQKFIPGEIRTDCQENPKKESVRIIKKVQFNN